MALVSAVIANPFWARQDEPAGDPAVDDAVSSVSAAESSASASGTAPLAAETSASAAETAPPPEETNNNGTAAATSTLSGTAAATLNSTTTTSTPTPSVSCHKSSSTRPEERIQNPFCEPKPGQILVVGQTYPRESPLPFPNSPFLQAKLTNPVTWDPTLFANESTNNILLRIVTPADSDGNTESQVIWKHEGVRNEEGQVSDFLVHHDTFDAEEFGLKNNTNLTLFIKSEPSDQPVWSGPTLTLLVNKNSKNGTKDGKDNHIGEKAGIPVGLGVFLIAVAGLVFWFLRRRKNKSAGYMAKRKGGSRMTGDETGVGGGFRDEPTRGMELQDRQGHGRQDSWDAGWDSTSSQGGGGNTFRDEIDRQRRR
ncbi:MAG: hypothetical protein Q9198_008506 [Flavoplaca austrocitrina]